MEEKNPIQVTDRLFLVLETLADTGPVTLAALCQHLDLNKSTVHRLLSSLIYAGYVRQDPESGKYALSYKILTLSNKILGHMDILETVRPFFRQLSQDTGETVHFVQLDGLEAIYIYKQESYQNSVRMASMVGNRIPLYCSGVGKAMMADMDGERVSRIWNHSDVRKMTPNTVVDYPRFLEMLEEVRLRGYALDNEEHELGVRCIAASIPDYSGRPSYAFSISAPVTRMSDSRIEELSRIVLDTKTRIAETMAV